ncbi:MAG TPA: lipase maturation factor family protein [Verrucomicrobiae bacterium]
MGSIGNVAHPPEKPVMIYDGDCHFCKSWIARWRQITCEKVDYIPLQDPQTAARFPEIERAQLEKAVHLVEPDGTIWRGAEAVFHALAARRAWPLWLYHHVPGFAGITEFFYAFIARHRPIFSRLTRLLWGKHVERPSFICVRWVFLRMLGFIYFCAFASLYVQLPGLYGKSGILPISQFMEDVRLQAGTLSVLRKLHAAPTLFWFNTSDSFIHGLCGAGIVLAILTIIGISPALCLGALWFIYLSFSTVGGDFLSFQWDSLLLETGLLAIFFAPIRLWPNPRKEQPPSQLILWLLRWLLFRLMFWSGVVKLESGDPTWHNWTALKFHYETQPLPTWLGWYAHQLPPNIQKFSVLLVFIVQLGFPFLILLPRRARQLACWTFISLELLIGLTGNYCFFNLLSISLCLLLLDDFVVLKWIPRKWHSSFEPVAPRASTVPGTRPLGVQLSNLLRSLRRITVALLTIFVLVITSMLMLHTLRVNVAWPRPLLLIYTLAAPFRSINSYGLFAVMTTTRPEIIIEGSNDGVTWLPYEFKYKPGDLKRRPRFVEPHQPRLDWQMWFAALGSFRGNPWFVLFSHRLLDGTPEVLALLQKNPFPNAPPKYLRAMVYEYHFTNWPERKATGAWWKRQEPREYLPVISLDNFRRP